MDENKCSQLSKDVWKFWRWAWKHFCTTKMKSEAKIITASSLCYSRGFTCTVIFVSRYVTQCHAPDHIRTNPICVSRGVVGYGATGFCCLCKQALKAALCIWEATCAKSVLHLGPMLWFFKYFRRKNLQKNLAFLTQNKAKFWKKLIITLVFKKNAIFSPKIGKNRRKLWS
jgi:hypothetical protein